MINDFEKQVCNYVNSCGRYTTQPRVIMNAFWFNLSSYINIVRPEILIDNDIVNMRFFSITMASSGGGKSFAEEKSKELINIDEEKWNNHQRLSFSSDETINIQGKDISLAEYLPEFVVSADNTNEGIYLRAKAQSMCFGGSLNITISEMFDYIGDNLAISKELYDGKLLGKATKTNINKNISNIVSNLLLFGSVNKMKRDKKIKDIFRNNLETGLYRRSFIYFQEPEPKQRHKLKKDDFMDFKDYISLIVESFIKNNIKNIKKNEYPRLQLTEKAEKKIDKIYDEFEKFEIEHFEHPLFQGEIGSVQKIISLAGLYSIATGSTSIDDEALDYAYKYHIKCRDTIHNVFNVEPQHIAFYKIISKNNGITRSEIMEQDDFDAKSFGNDILMLEEYCYRKNMKLVRSGSKIEKYRIDELAATDLEKIIISVPRSGADKKEKTIEYRSLEIPFFGDGQTVETLIHKKPFTNFTLCHFKERNDIPIRNSNNFIGTENAIAFDIDGSISIDDAVVLLSNFKYIIYTTRSHQKEKGGIICDRFRIILPAKHTFNVTADQHKQLYKNIADALGLTMADVSCFNAGRLFFL